MKITHENLVLGGWTLNLVNASQPKLASIDYVNDPISFNSG